MDFIFQLLQGPWRLQLLKSEGFNGTYACRKTVGIGHKWTNIMEDLWGYELIPPSPEGDGEALMSFLFSDASSACHPIMSVKRAVRFVFHTLSLVFINNSIHVSPPVKLQIRSSLHLSIIFLIQIVLLFGVSWLKTPEPLAVWQGWYQ